MIEYLEGAVLAQEDDYVIINVGGVGYGVAVPPATAFALSEVGSEARLWTYTYVREDQLKLFGFATRHERNVFEVFIGLQGVGPQIGLAILSTLSIGEIIQAAAGGDASPFKRVKGIGPKLAEKLIIELKGRINRLSAGLPQEMLTASSGDNVTDNNLDESTRDAIAALEALGVSGNQARRAIDKALDVLGQTDDVEALVREGLKHRRA